MTTAKPARFLAGALLVSLLLQSPAFAFPLSAPFPSPAYDVLNRLTQVSSLRGGGAPEAVSLATHTYDGEGKRITSTEGGVTTAYLYDGLLPVLERQGSSTTVNVWGLSLGGGIGGLLARTTSTRGER